MFRSARVKLTLLLVAIVSLLYAFTAVSVYAVMDRIALGQADGALRLLAARIEQGGGAIPFPLGPFGMNARRSLMAVVVKDARGHVLEAYGPGGAALRLPAPAGAALEPSFVTMRSNVVNAWLRVMTVWVPAQSGSGVYLQAAWDVDPQENLLLHLRSVLFRVGMAGAALALLAGFWASGRALLPIARSWNNQRRFVADASHELRTPLAVIESNLDVVLGHADQTVLDNLEWIGAAKTEARRLTRLTDDLLTLARADAREMRIRKIPVDVSEAAGQTVEGLALIAQAKGLALNAAPRPEVALVVGDPDRIRQLCVILLDNAIKYTPIGGRIDVDVTRHRQYVRLRVQDTGIGMDKAVRDRIFDRFYRGDEARHRESGGTGLGLSIAEWIVRMHGGRIGVQSEPGAGTTFTVWLRAATDGLPAAAGLRREGN